MILKNASGRQQTVVADVTPGPDHCAFDDAVATDTGVLPDRQGDELEVFRDCVRRSKDSIFPDVKILQST